MIRPAELALLSLSRDWPNEVYEKSGIPTQAQAVSMLARNSGKNYGNRFWVWCLHFTLHGHLRLGIGAVSNRVFGKDKRLVQDLIEVRTEAKDQGGITWF